MIAFRLVRLCLHILVNVHLSDSQETQRHTWIKEKPNREARTQCNASSYVLLHMARIIYIYICIQKEERKRERNEYYVGYNFFLTACEWEKKRCRQFSMPINRYVRMCGVDDRVFTIKPHRCVCFSLSIAEVYHYTFLRHHWQCLMKKNWMVSWFHGFIRRITPVDISLHEYKITENSCGMPYWNVWASRSEIIWVSEKHAVSITVICIFSYSWY